MATWYSGAAAEDRVEVNLTPLFKDIPNMRSDLEVRSDATCTITVPRDKEYQPVEVPNWQVHGYLKVKGNDGKDKTRRVIISGSHPFLYWPEKVKGQKKAQRWKHRMKGDWKPGKLEWLNGPPDGRSFVVTFDKSEKPKPTITTTDLHRPDIYPVGQPLQKSKGTKVEPVVWRQLDHADPVPDKTKRDGEWGVMFNVDFPPYVDRIEEKTMVQDGKEVTCPTQIVRAYPTPGPVWIKWDSPYHPVEVRPRRAYADLEDIDGEEINKVELRSKKFRYWPPPLPGQVVPDIYKHKAYGRFVTNEWRVEPASKALPTSPRAHPMRPGSREETSHQPRGKEHYNWHYEMVRLPPVPWTFREGEWRNPATGKLYHYDSQTRALVFQPFKFKVQEKPKFFMIRIPQPDIGKATLTIPNPEHLDDPDTWWRIPKHVMVPPNTFRFSYIPLPQPGWEPPDTRDIKWLYRDNNREFRAIAFDRRGDVITKIGPRDKPLADDYPLDQKFKYPGLFKDVKDIPPSAIRPHPGPGHKNRRARKYGTDNYSRFARIAMMNTHGKAIKGGRVYEESRRQASAAAAIPMYESPPRPARSESGSPESPTTSGGSPPGPPAPRNIGKSSFYIGDIGAGKSRTEPTVWEEAHDRYGDEETPTEVSGSPGDVANMSDFDESPEAEARRFGGAKPKRPQKRYDFKPLPFIKEESPSPPAVPRNRSPSPRPLHRPSSVPQIMVTPPSPPPRGRSPTPSRSRSRSLTERPSKPMSTLATPVKPPRSPKFTRRPSSPGPSPTARPRSSAFRERPEEIEMKPITQQPTARPRAGSGRDRSGSGSGTVTTQPTSGRNRSGSGRGVTIPELQRGRSYSDPPHEQGCTCDRCRNCTIQ